MTPREKASELYAIYGKIVSKPINGGGYRFGLQQAKKCALVAINEILSMGIFSESGDWKMAKSYWEEVKKEIELL